MTLRRFALFGLVTLLLPLLGLLVLSLLSRRAPTLGMTDGRLRPCPGSPNCVCSQETDAEHTIPALAFTGEPADAWRTLRRILEQSPRISIISADEGYLHATATTRLLRFVDDVEFLLDSEASRIHVRSASRQGHSDLGANRNRVEQIRRAFEKALAE